MKYIAAYILAKLGGIENPTEENIKEIIETVGIEFDNKKATEIVGNLNGKDIKEVIDDGKSKLSAVSNDETTRYENQETSKEENENENKEEEELDLGGGFDDLFA